MIDLNGWNRSYISLNLEKVNKKTLFNSAFKWANFVVNILLEQKQFLIIKQHAFI